MDEFEYLHVTGRGANREAALQQADSIAAKFYGEPPDLSKRQIGRAAIGASMADGTVVYFEVEVTYV